ncbi:MAG: hypothetical protein AAGB04_06275 [Pseudomonadota bacterium]
MRFAALAVLSWALLAAQTIVSSAADCKATHGAEMKADGQSTGLSARIAITPETVPVGSPFSATVVICGAKGDPVERFTIDATMPRHRHGMNYKPKIVSGGDAAYKATGLFFHMPGLWRFEVIVQAPKKRQRFTYDVNAK